MKPIIAAILTLLLMIQPMAREVVRGAVDEVRGIGSTSATLDLSAAPLMPVLHESPAGAAVARRAPKAQGDVSLSAFCDGVSEMPTIECQALETLYNSTGGPSWTAHTDWLVTTTPCSWYGVACAGGRVTELHLGYNMMTGTIPPQLGNLSNLQVLDLVANQFSGAIPSELGNLTSLAEVDLSSNQLTGGIPSTLGNLTALQMLFLESNQLDGSLPATLGNLTSLATFYAYSNQLSGNIPAEMGQMSSLEDLDLSENQLWGNIPSQLGNATSLRWLFLERNQLTGNIPATIGNLTLLEQLELSQNRLDGSIPSTIGNLTSLNSLGLQMNALQGEVPLSMTSLVNLGANTWDFVDLGYNALIASNPAVASFLTSKDPNWASTQTVPPANLHVTGATTTQVSLGWTPILYTADGGYYEISYATNPSGPYTVHGTTASKTASTYTASGLPLAATHYLRVRTYTPAHGSQQNNVWSAYSAVVTATHAVPMSLALAPGWNLVSLSQVPATTVITQVLAPIAGTYDLVYAYDATSPTPWKKYNTSMPPFLNTLRDLDERMGFWIRTTSAVTLTVAGTIPVSTTIPLRTGWNLVGYPCQTTQPITQALSSIDGKYDLIYAFHAADPDQWKKYNTLAPPFLNDLQQMAPGWGYWIRVTVDCLMSIPGQ